MSNKKSTVVDLFAGVGGFSLGAARAGFHVTAAVEIDPIAISSHQENFPNSVHLRRDISTLSGEDILSEFPSHEREIAGVIGGPPCQGFSTIGRRRLDDPRNDLLKSFFRLVAEIKPAFFVAENVPGILSARNSDHVQDALSSVSTTYSILEPITLKASEFGVPTSRTRVFFIGFDSRKMNPLLAAEIQSEHFADVRVRNALMGMPRIHADWQTEAQSWRSVGTLGRSDFEKRIRGHIPKGVGSPQAIDRYRKGREVSGFLGTRHSQESVRRFDDLSPGETDRISRAQRLDLNGYCPTIRAGTGPERGSYQAVRPIHPTSPRVICPREAARLQGFPDWFQFHPTKWHAFRQIGNSVSPIVAERILQKVISRLR